MAKISVAARKAKARWLQDKVTMTLRRIFKVDKDLTPQDDNAHIQSKQMGGSGVDNVFSPTMKQIIGWSTECKNQSRINIPDFWRQTRDTAKKNGNQPILFVKYPKFQQPLVIQQYDDFFEQYGNIISFAFHILEEYSKYTKENSLLMLPKHELLGRTRQLSELIKELEQFLPMRELDHLRKQYHNEKMD